VEARIYKNQGFTLESSKTQADMENDYDVIMNSGTVEIVVIDEGKKILDSIKIRFQNGEWILQ
jgi:hypothetical protein